MREDGTFKSKTPSVYARIIAGALSFAVLPALLSACGTTTQIWDTPAGTPDLPEVVSIPSTNAPVTDSGTAVIGPELTPLGGPPAVPIVLVPVASGERTESNEKAVIDYSNAADGYVMIKWVGGSVERGLRVQIIGPGETIPYTYILSEDGEYEVYPLSDGNGTYTVRAVEMLTDGRGSVALTATIDVALVDEFAPFLRPNQYVNFNEDSLVVAKASELLTAQDDFISKIAAIYDYVINNITYDVNLANEIIAGMHPNYLPDLDNVLARKKGICFDFAAVMAAMLRSQGIPTKLVVGDVNGDVRHAWLNVYSETEGWIDAVIFFAGEDWQMMDPTFASSGSTDALREFIGDGSNYVELYLY